MAKGAFLGALALLLVCAFAAPAGHPVVVFGETHGPKFHIPSFAVAVGGSRGKGAFVAFGDDALFQNRFLTGGNHLLGENLAGWLVAGR